MCDDGPGFGPGFAPDADANTGLERVENIARHDLRAHISYLNRPEGGARVVMTFPIDRSASE